MWCGMHGVRVCGAMCGVRVCGIKCSVRMPSVVIEQKFQPTPSVTKHELKLKSVCILDGVLFVCA